MLPENKVLIVITIRWCGGFPWVQRAFNHKITGDGENSKPEIYTPGTRMHVGSDSVSAPAKSKYVVKIQTAVIIQRKISSGPKFQTHGESFLS